MGRANEVSNAGADPPAWERFRARGGAGVLHEDGGVRSSTIGRWLDYREGVSESILDWLVVKSATIGHVARPPGRGDLTTRKGISVSGSVLPRLKVASGSISTPRNHQSRQPGLQTKANLLQVHNLMDIFKAIKGLKVKIRFQIKRMDKYLASVDEEIVGGDLHKLKLIYEGVSEIKTKTGILFDELFKQEEVDEEKEFEGYETIQDKMEKLELKLRRALEGMQSTADTKQTKGLETVILPKFELPHFYGDANSWFNFKQKGAKPQIFKPVSEINNTSIEQGSETINQVLLATAQIIVEGEGGTQQICRALLDSGSQPEELSGDQSPSWPLFPLRLKI
ncbi:hypothetical protein LAZ67_3005191 [Cordylochernes scorpioides]|uniref:Peptidase A2 domain-containing protein n=1 Tax=Cordylochernes scorpioides TaxID=51811 RepID=A0ABY6KBF4_9ARAC|nr:hypothetical protein LAZ67_3005191 [Cordylochernes scorpioides]